jgi:hypothetical protein
VLAGLREERDGLSRTVSHCVSLTASLSVSLTVSPTVSPTVSQGRTRRGRVAMAAAGDAAASSGAEAPRADSADEATERSRPAQSASEAPPGSLRTLDADVTTMHSTSLGRLLLPPEGSGALKASVMGMLHGNVHQPPKHNKYSGIQVRCIGGA